MPVKRTSVWRRAAWLIALALIGALLPEPASAQEAAANVGAYPVAAEFKLIYERLGGADALGLTITRPYYLDDDLVQYFHRGRLEMAGRNSDLPLGSVRVSDLGIYLAQLTGESAGLAFQPASPADDDLYFAQTQHSIHESFRDYWVRRGGNERFGPPISVGHTRGGRFAQWFAKGLLEVTADPPNGSTVGEGQIGKAYLGFPRDERDAVESVPPLYARQIADPAYGFDAPILYYHDVPDGELFERQIVGLLEAGFTPVPFSRLVRSLTCCATLPPNPIVITFDDGWTSQVEVALPVLLKLRIPATFFVMPGFDSKQPKHMTYQDFETLAESGMSVQSHTINHAELPPLVRFNLGAAQAETVQSRQLLERFGGVDYLAFPFGAFDLETEALLARAGYVAAVSTAFGRLHFREDLLHLPRIAANPSGPPSTVLADLQRASPAER